MPDIHVKKPLVRDAKDAKYFHSFSINPNNPKPEGVKVGRAGRRKIASDERGERESPKQKFDNNYDRIFKKK